MNSRNERMYGNHHSTGALAILGYVHLKKLVITEKYFSLFTKIQFAVTFKEGMDQRQIDAFVPYIKMHCPGIKVI